MFYQNEKENNKDKQMKNKSKELTELSNSNKIIFSEMMKTAQGELSKENGNIAKQTTQK